MAACHIKNGNYQRAVETADKVRSRPNQHVFAHKRIPHIIQALAKNENNGKAMFRKAKALGELGYFEKAVKILEDLKKKSPTGKRLLSCLAPHCARYTNSITFTDVASADQEIARLTVIDNERERVHKKKMKGKSNFLSSHRNIGIVVGFHADRDESTGFLNKAEKKGTPLFDESSAPAAIKSGFIEEVKDDDNDDDNDD